MSKEAYLKSQRLYLVGNLLLGLLMLAAAFAVNLFNIFDYGKTIVALSLLPFGLAIAIAVNLYQINKYPRKMHPLMASEIDERLKAIKNESDSITFRILRWALLFFYLGYTFIIPEDIFEAPGWWIVLAFLMAAYLLQEILFEVKQRKDKNTLDDE